MLWGRLFEARLAQTVDSLKIENKFMCSLNDQTKIFQPE